MTETCQTCRYSRLVSIGDHGDESGEWRRCKRAAPRPRVLHTKKWANTGDADFIAEWPRVAADEWCGEHRPKPEPAHAITHAEANDLGVAVWVREP